MMMHSGFGYSVAPAIMALHGLFCLITIVGVILFLMWAYRLKEPKLRELTYMFLAVGIVGLFLTIVVGSFMMQKKAGEKNMYFRMMDIDDRNFMFKASGGGVSEEL